jgi:major membrane immunogen (membrane-anchored lipoprotein)
MKKILAIFFLLFSMTVLGEGYIDGTYYVIADKGTWGWKPFTEVVIKDGKIENITFDRINKKGELASFDEGYNKRMGKKKGMNPEKYSVEIPANFFAVGNNFDNMDSFAGATDSLREFKIMMNFLLEKATKGETGSFEIKKSDLN